MSMRALSGMEFSSPGVHRGVDVSKIPLIRGDLAVRLHVPLPSEEVELLLGKRGVDDC